MSKTIILVANEDEANHLKDLVFNHTPEHEVCILITGEGRTNVIRTLSQKILDGFITSNDKIINVGYVGAKGIKTGEIVKIGSVQHFIPSHTIKETTIYLDGKYSNDSYLNKYNVSCYTGDNFVEYDDIGPWFPDEFVCDMELYYIALMFPEVISFKIVSDTLDYDEYKKADFEESWMKVVKTLKEML